MTATTTAIGKHAQTRVPLNDLLHRRWSPRAFDSRPVPNDTLLALFEAARWAPSGGNGQPWSFIVAIRESDPAGFAQALALLNESNQRWVQHAPVLVFGITRMIRPDGKEHFHALYDLGLAVENLVIQAGHEGLIVHQMAGFDREGVRATYGIPAAHQPVVAFTVGYPGNRAALPDDLQARELARRERKPLTEFVFANQFGETAAFVAGE